MSKAGWSGRYFSFSAQQGSPINYLPSWVDEDLAKKLKAIEDTDYSMKHCNDCYWFITNSTEKLKKHNKEVHGDPDWDNKTNHSASGASYTSPYVPPNAFSRALRTWPARPRTYIGPSRPAIPSQRSSTSLVEDWDGTEIIRGYRSYSIGLDDWTPILNGFHGVGWIGAELIAECNGSVEKAEKHLLSDTCSCGIYMLKRNNRQYGYQASVQCIAGGVVVEGTNGYRASIVCIEKIWVGENSSNLIALLERRYGVPVEFKHQ